MFLLQVGQRISHRFLKFPEVELPDGATLLKALRTTRRQVAAVSMIANSESHGGHCLGLDPAAITNIAAAKQL